MKKYLVLLFIVYASIAKSQTDVPLNVPGIGHGATVNDPTYRFSFSGFPVGHYGLGWYAEGGGSPMGYLSGYAGLRFFTLGIPRMNIDIGGNVGIGISSPQSILHVISSSLDIGATSKSGQGLLIESKTGGRFQNKGAQLEFVIPANTDGTNPWAQGRIVTVAGNSLDGSAVGKMIIGTKRLFNKIGGGNEWLYGDDIVIDGVGNIGLGTLIPREKLSVNGNIRAKEIKVENGNWPDYVFSENYTLPTLEQTEKHIKENGHLSGIPSAEEVKSNGIDLGEMNAKLLQKIEELTLYLIEKDKEINQLKKLSDRVTKLESKK